MASQSDIEHGRQIKQEISIGRRIWLGPHSFGSRGRDWVADLLVPPPLLR